MPAKKDCNFIIMKKYLHLFLQLLVIQGFSIYKSSRFGYLWIIIQPIILLFVYMFVFAFVFNVRWSDGNSAKSDFALMMFCGMAVFRIISDGIKNSSYAIINNVKYVKKIIFPLEILPTVQVAAVTVVSFIWFFLLFIAVVAIHKTIPAAIWLLLPILLIPVTVFTLGLGFIAAALTVYIRDVSYCLQALFQILFFATPIVYPLERIPEPYRQLIAFNPMSAMIDFLRNCLLMQGSFDIFVYVKLCIISLCCFGTGLFLFRRLRGGFADVI